MVNWNDHDQVHCSIWSEHKEVDDHIVPQPNQCNGNSFSKVGRDGKKHRHGDDCIAVSPAKETKNDFLSFNVKYSSGSHINQEINHSSIDMDAWPDLPNLSITFGGGISDGIVRDSVITGLVSDVDNASDMRSVGGFIEGYSHSCVLHNDKDSSSLSKASVLLSVNDMQLDGEPDLFGYDNNQNDKFVDYDWANIEDFSDLDKMFVNNDDSLFGNEIFDNAGTFLTTSADLINSSPQSIPVPVILISGEQTSEDFSYCYQLGEHSVVKTDSPNKTLRAKKDDVEKFRSSEGPNNYWYNKNLHIPSTTSALNPIDTVKSQSTEEPSLSHHLMFADYGYHPYQFHGSSFSPQKCAGKIQHKPAYSAFSKHQKAVEASSKAVNMTPQEKIEKLRRRQQMQAMLAIQKQQEQYNSQLSGSDVTELSQKLPSSDASSLSEQDQPQMISSSHDGHSVEEVIYFQLQDAMRKLDMNVRLSIRDSLYRLARSAMERQIWDGSTTSMCNKEEDEISADEESNSERYLRLSDSEAVTNPIDRIVAHLLFHNPSGSAHMPIADGDISMTTST